MLPSRLFSAVFDQISGHREFRISDSKESLRADQIYSKVMQIRATLKELKVSSGDRVVVSSGRGLDIWCDFLATWSLDAVVVPVGKDISPDIRSYVLGLVNPKVVDGTSFPGYQATSPADEVLRGRVKSPTGAIIFTSGSTGRPKGVVLSTKAIYLNALGTRERLGLSDVHTMLLPIPCHFVSALSHMLVCNLSQANMVIRESISLPSEMLTICKENGINAIGGAPLHMRWLCDFPSDAGIKWAMSSGDRLGADLALALLQKFPDIQLRAVYGLTELAGRFCIADNEQIHKLHSTVGTPIPGLKCEIRPSDSDIGNVIASGETLMEGYLQDFINDPSYKPILDLETGDLGRLVGGLLELNGRSDDVFKVSGLKVSSPEVCEALMRSKLFQDVYVTQVEHPLLGTVVGAYYMASREVTLPEILPKLRPVLPAYCIPRVLTKVPLIPRTGSGKINRQKMRAIIAENGGSN